MRMDPDREPDIGPCRCHRRRLEQLGFIVGRTIVMVFNLKPAKLMGIESNGMVLAASPDGGKPTLVGFDQEIPPGVRVR